MTQSLRFAVDSVTPLPDLTAAVPTNARWDVTATSVEHTHVDTAEHDLWRAGVELYRFSGDGSAGWRLSLPGQPSRDVVDTPRSVAAVEVPVALAAATVGVRRGRPVVPLATVRVHRTVHRLTDADGAPLLDLADETVHSSTSTPDGALLEDWRRWQLDGPGPVAAVADRLVDAGGVPDSDPGSDLARALVGHPGADPAAPVTSPSKHGKRKGKGKAAKHRPTAGELIRTYLRAQDDALAAGDLVLRAGTGGIHPTRVATRRLRSTLRIFRPFVDADRAASFDAELSWYAATLGEVRDREVQRLRMRKLLDEIPDELVLGPVGSSIDAVLRSEEVLHRGRLAEALDSERYLALLREAHFWSTTPPFTDRADADAEVLTKRVDKAAAKLVAHLAAGLRAGGDDEELHSARKAGKRARYAAELAAPVLGKKGTKLVSRYEEVQDVLGDFQDGVVACALIRRLAAGTVGKRKENGFTYGLLYARERERAIEGRQRADVLFAKLRD